MPLLLVDGLEPADAAALRAHLATGCPRCAGYLAEAHATLALLPFSLQPVTPPDSAREKLFERLRVQPPAVAAPALRLRRLRMPVWMRRVAPVAVAACLAVVITGAALLPALEKYKAAYASAVAQSRQREVSLTTQRQMMDQYLHLVHADELKLINLQGRAQPKAWARAIWDSDRQVWRFFAKNLEPLSKRETYQLWFITPYGRKVPAAKFSVEADGSTEIMVPPVPAEVGPIEAAMITDEPYVGTWAPTGTVHLYGKLE